MCARPKFNLPIEKPILAHILYGQVSSTKLTFRTFPGLLKATVNININYKVDSICDQILDFESSSGNFLGKLRITGQKLHRAQYDPHKYIFFSTLICPHGIFRKAVTTLSFLETELLTSIIKNYIDFRARETATHHVFQK